MTKKVDIEKEWGKALTPFFETSTWTRLNTFIEKEYRTKKVYPKPKDLFKAFALTPLSKVKVVILGQDPYHGENQAHGLSFSVENGVRVPPSLKNIYKEIEADVGIQKDFSNGNLEPWAKQGVFLLNAVLSVVAGTPASHQKRGWEEFTDLVIKTISEKQEPVVVARHHRPAAGNRRKRRRIRKPGPGAGHQAQGRPGPGRWRD